jgi:hypothetical protein
VAWRVASGADRDGSQALIVPHHRNEQVAAQPIPGTARRQSKGSVLVELDLGATREIRAGEQDTGDDELRGPFRFTQGRLAADENHRLLRFQRSDNCVEQDLGNGSPATSRRQLDGKTPEVPEGPEQELQLGIVIAILERLVEIERILDTASTFRLSVSQRQREPFMQPLAGFQTRRRHVELV